VTVATDCGFHWYCVGERRSPPARGAWLCPGCRLPGQHIITRLSWHEGAWRLRYRWCTGARMVLSSALLFTMYLFQRCAEVPSATSPASYPSHSCTRSTVCRPGVATPPPLPHRPGHCSQVMHQARGQVMHQARGQVMHQARPGPAAAAHLHQGLANGACGPKDDDACRGARQQQAGLSRISDTVCEQAVCLGRMRPECDSCCGQWATPVATACDRPVWPAASE
jgi:hypothetical protein